ncbi:hypothetical protein AAHA92_27848 [Salvia divinorum]|uniref:Uncharacterized protein n=1 Tax=Salvia divinorum TaxID=28513 RepID=A0ABD1G4Z1_SALDI
MESDTTHRTLTDGTPARHWGPLLLFHFNIRGTVVGRKKQGSVRTEGSFQFLSELILRFEIGRIHAISYQNTPQEKRHNITAES